MDAHGWERFPRETAAVRDLASYAGELFPGRVQWRVSEGLFAFEVRDARPRIWVALDQEIVVEVGRRHWEIPYGHEGAALARQVLRDAADG